MSCRYKMFINMIISVGIAALATSSCSSSGKAWTGTNGSSEGSYKVGNPYEIGGEWYYPHEDYSYDEIGVASWYGADFHKDLTANGEIYDMYAMTAAHKTLPLPSVVRVTNLENGRSVILRVNDRGPFVVNRIVDVSKSAAERLGFHSKGTTRVRVTIMPKESKELKQAMLNNEAWAKNAYKSDANNYSNDVSLPAKSGGSNYTSSIRSVTKAPVVATAYSRDGNQSAYETGRNTYATNNVKPLQASNASGWGTVQSGNSYLIQVGAFSVKKNAELFAEDMKRYGNVLISSSYDNSYNNNGAIYRVRLGPYSSKNEADIALRFVNEIGLHDARIVNSSDE